LQAGDFIRAINDTATRDMSEFAGRRLLRGAPGSKVTLLIIRNGNTGDPHPIDLVREVPPTSAVSARRLPGGEAYLRIASFGRGTAEAVRTAVAGLGAAAAPGLIVDVRDVADGTPEDGVDAARLFVKSGTLAILAGRPPATSDTSKKSDDGQPADNAAQEPPAPPIPDTAIRTTAGAGDGALAMPVVLLVSNGTAHAAEIFSAALADNHRARLVGEPTAGLAGVQQLIRLPDGYGLLLTTQRYLRTSGMPIQGRGLRPDVLVDIPTVDFDEPMPKTDAVLERGVKELKQPTSTADSSGPAAGTPARPDAGSGPAPAVPPTPPGSHAPNGPVSR
jgi:carboxyl-terminal processing protease